MKKIFFSGLLFLAVTLSATKLSAQDYRYGVTPFRPALVNPAYRFENKLVDVTAIYGIPYSKDLDNNNIHLDAHSQFRSDMGVGIKGNYYTPSDLRTEIMGGASYNYNLNLNDDMDFVVGVGGGVLLTQYDRSLAAVKDNTDGYVEVGIAYRWTNLYVGVAATMVIKDNLKSSIALNAKYDFKLCDNFTLSPLVGYTYYKGYQGTDNLGGIIDAGAMFGFNKWAEIGVAYASNGLVNAFASVWASDYIRVFYNGGIATDSSLRKYAPLRNEVGIRFMLGRK